MTDAQIKHMVDRFLSWKLPADFSPDAGISFKATFNEHTAHPMKHEPSGTNLLSAAQAEAMIRHMLEGIPPSQQTAGWQSIDTAPKNGQRVDIWLEPHDAMESGNAHRRPNAYFHRDDWWFTGNGVAYDVSASHHWRVTHWMPQPDAPALTSEGTV